MAEKHRVSVSLDKPVLEWIQRQPGSYSKVVGDCVKKICEQPEHSLVVSFKAEVMERLQGIATQQERQVEDQVQWIVKTWIEDQA